MSIQVTKHAQERYAERIAKREELIDINMYIARNEEKIVGDIEKMLEHSELIYTGKVGARSKNPVNVYVTGTWILLTDISNENLITLYKVDLCAGEDLNKEFVDRMLKRIEECKEKLDEKRKEISEDRETYQNIIKEDEALIKEYTAAIKNIQSSKNAYEEIVKNLNDGCNVAELELRQAVENLVMKKEF